MAELPEETSSVVEGDPKVDKTGSAQDNSPEKPGHLDSAEIGGGERSKSAKKRKKKKEKKKGVENNAQSCV